MVVDYFTKCKSVNLKNICSDHDHDTYGERGDMFSRLTIRWKFSPGRYMPALAYTTSCLAYSEQYCSQQIRIYQGCAYASGVQDGMIFGSGDNFLCANWLDLKNPSNTI